MVVSIASAFMQAQTLVLNPTNSFTNECPPELLMTLAIVNFNIKVLVVFKPFCCSVKESIVVPRSGSP